MGILQTLNGLSGLIGVLLALLGLIAGGFYLSKSGANAAQQSALTAMQEEISILRSRIDDIKEDNARQKQIVQTICAALEIEGIIITITGDMVNIRNKGGTTTTARIQNKEVK